MKVGRRRVAVVSAAMLLALAGVALLCSPVSAVTAVPGAVAARAHVTVRDFVFSAGFHPHHHPADAVPASTVAGAPEVGTAFATETFTVALVDADLPQRVWLYRPVDPPGVADDAAHASSADALDANAVYPEEVQDSANGLTRLVCGGAGDGANEVVYESVAPRRDAAPDARGWLVPLEPQHFHQPLYQLLAGVYGERGLVPEPMPSDQRRAASATTTAAGGGVARLHFALLLSSRDARGTAYTPAAALLKAIGSSDAVQVASWMRTHCALEFVAFGEQLQHTHTRGPAGAYVTRPPHAQPLVPHHSVAEHKRLLESALHGAVPLATEPAIPVAAAHASGSSLLAAMDLHTASDHLDTGLDAVSGYMYGRYGKGGERAYSRVCGDRNQRRTRDPNMPDPLDDELDAEAEEDAVVGELSLEEGGGWTSAPHNSTAAERSRIGRGLAFASVDEAYFELVPLVKPILNGLLPPVKELMVETLGSVLGFFMGRGMGGTIEMGLTDLIPKHLYKKLAGPIGHRLPPGIAEAVVDLVPPLVAATTRDYVVKHLTPKITEALTLKLDKALSQSIPYKVEYPYTSDLTRQLSRDVGHMLSKSLPHSLVASLVHSLTHSPLTDYYCYYCNKEQRYCEYCTYEPKQAYYALYYAGYYTTYYADYYARYYADVAKARSDRRRSDDIQYLSANEHYSIVLDPSADDTKLMS